ncbi:hypothetical protein Scep_003532 [Stephania cephalantha]|uniref:UspA domain-containing protein n=1 Tax=Stephania cephalantha TaxID=152367 RepID=A0AAP0KQP1_9MAGN
MDAIEEKPPESPPESPPAPPSASSRRKKKKKVVVAIDESEGSFHALRWALDYLFSAADAAAAPPLSPPSEKPVLGLILILHVRRPLQKFIVPAAPGPAVGIYVPSSSVIESVKKAQEQNSSLLLSRALKLCKEWPVKAEKMVMEGDPKEMICEAVENTRPDLLVLGSRGLGSLQRTFLGSVSDYCAHHAKCPVLIVRPQSKEPVQKK